MDPEHALPCPAPLSPSVLRSLNPLPSDPAAGPSRRITPYGARFRSWSSCTAAPWHPQAPAWRQSEQQQQQPLQGCPTGQPPARSSRLPPPRTAASVRHRSTRRPQVPVRRPLRTAARAGCSITRTIRTGRTRRGWQLGLRRARAGTGQRIPRSTARHRCRTTMTTRGGRVPYLRQWRAGCRGRTW